MMNRKQIRLKPRLQRLLLLLICLVTSVGKLSAKVHFNSTDVDMMKLLHSPTIDNPYIKIDVLYFDAAGSDSYFIGDDDNDSASVWVDGRFICRPIELTWNGHQKTANNYRDENDWTDNVYENDYCIIRFFDPRHEASSGDAEHRYRIYMYVFLKAWEAGATHTVKVGGTWKINDNKFQGWEEREVTTAPFTLPSWGGLTSRMTSCNKVSIDGQLAKNYGTTTVGIYKKGSTAPTEYSADLKGTKTCSKGQTSFEDLSATLDNFDYVNGTTVPVQYSVKTQFKKDASESKMTSRLISMVVYKWFTTDVYGFVKPKNISCQLKDQWAQTVTIGWNVDSLVAGTTDQLLNRVGSWTVFNATTNELLKSGVKSDSTRTSVRLPDYNTEYDIDVYFVPKDEPELPQELSTSGKGSLVPNWQFSSLTATENAEGKIDLAWAHNSVNDASGNNKYTLFVQRSLAPEKGWEDIGSLDIDSKNTTGGTYTDGYELQSNQTYYYRLKVNIFGDDQLSSTAFTRIGGSKITSLTASRGSYSNMVKLQWTVKQVGANVTNFTVQRHPLGSSPDSGWADIYSTSGTASTYSYDDVTALPGSYNEYRVLAWSMNGDVRTDDDQCMTDGFSVSTGTISGNIAYGTGTAVEGAKVTLKQQNSDGDISSGLRCVRLADFGTGFRYDCDTSTLKELLGGNFSVQMYVSPDATVMNDSTMHYQLMDIYNTFGLYLHYDGHTGHYRLGVSLNQHDYDSQLTLVPDTWTQINCVHSKADHQTVLCIVEGDAVKCDTVISGQEAASVKVPQIDSEARCLSIGNNSLFSSEAFFHGYLDEFRFWTKQLTTGDIQKNYNHPLAGSEQELAIYYPFDEGLEHQTMAYDMSKCNGIGNGRHASAKVAASTSTNLPSESQMSLMSYTDVNGYYEIRGVPFSGEGTSYTIVPTLGIHEFSPGTRSRYVSMSSLNHSGVDFSDVSSFPVSGKIFYADTDYPLAGATLSVDGIICSKDGDIIYTDQDGAFTISVPIGDHFITVALSGHEFVDGGRYPADPNGVGLKHTFDREIRNLEFYDATLVNFTGRVVGGDVEGKKDLGFGLSQNNIGVAELVLTPLVEKPRLNVEKQIDETSYQYVTRETILPVASATDRINSHSWRGAGADDCRKIFIHTDSLTGEFSAMVPPLQYNVDEIRVVATGLTVGPSSFVDLSNPAMQRSDSLRQDKSIEETYTYNVKLMQTYHSTPEFHVTQADHDDGAFGLATYTMEDELGSIVIDDIYTVAGGQPVYHYGGAIFNEYDEYTFNIEAYEEYVNSDNAKAPVTYRVPLEDLVVTIDNALSVEQAVTSQETTVDGETYRTGEVVQLKSNQLRLDSLGCATYTWMAGLPNISTPYTRTISISYDIDGRTYLWNEDGLTGIILGDMPTGNNFVTAGPDMLEMILRDPPGSKSSAEWTSGTVTTKAHSHSGTLNFDGHLIGKAQLSPTVITGVGMGVWTAEVTSISADYESGLKAHIDYQGDHKVSTTIEQTKTISTSDAMEFVGAPGDIFIGSATNIIFGAANNVGFHRVPGTDQAALDVQESISTGTSFSTLFCYTQNYIENMLLPNFELMRNNMLKTVSQSELDSYVNNGKYPVYLTTLLPSDPQFGKLDTYTMIVPQNTTESFTDSVSWCNTQIEAWIVYLRYNEANKVYAYDNRDNSRRVTYYQNHSFTSGSSVTASYEKQHYEDTDHLTVNVQLGLHLNLLTGLTVNEVGAFFDAGFDLLPGYHYDREEGETEKTGFKYILAEDGDDNAITVDVYDCGAYGPIFRTRGGQTSAPYEGRVVTKYYEPLGTTIMEPTMQIEVPQIDVDQPVVTDIPSGSTATYTLRLSNASETNELLYYRLGLAEETNPNGAMLFIDGAPVTDVRTILIQPHETVTKTLLLKQSDPSILDYERIGIVLASTSQYYPTYTWDAISDTAFISAHFVPSSSPVTLEISNNVMNTQTGTDLVLTMSDFDRGYRGLKAFRMEYRKSGETGWTRIQEYVLDEADKTDNNEMLPASGSTVSLTLPMSGFSDGEYIFRAVSVSTYGADDVTRTSDELTLVKDLQRPTPMGVPEPSDGVLDIGDELSVTFNETILKGELTNEANFSVTGVLNGAEVDHETALSMTATETAAATEAEINLAGKNFAFDMWVNLKGGAGTLLSHGNGTSKLTVGTDADNKLVVTKAGTTYTSTHTVPTGKWAFLTLSLTADGRLNATVADDAETTTLFMDQSVGKYEGKGALVVGKYMKGAMHELLLWDEVHDITTALLERSKTKNPSTRHLIGYWKMNEGEGTTIRDYARNRHMTMPDETWYLNNQNKAVSLDGQSYLNINASELPVCVDDDYALEFWMRGDKQTGEAQLLQMGDVALSLSAEGILQLTGKEAFNPNVAKTLTTSAKRLNDNAWHHVALNVLRQGTAAVYVDGRRCLSTGAANVGSITTNSLIMGARRTTFSAENADYGFDHPFAGQIDEVRVWNATMNGDQLIKNRKVRLTGSEDGLVAYYPFEKKTLDVGNQVITVGDASDLCGSGNVAQLTALDAQLTTLNYTDEAPALRTKPSETNVSFTFVASDEKVVITLDEDAATIEGCTLNFTVRDVRDENGNYSVPAVWSAYVNQQELEWQEDALDCVANVTEGATFSVDIINKSGSQQMWSLSGMPSWLSVSEEYGTTNPLKSSTVTFTVSTATPIGKYEETIYLVGNNNIEIPLVVSVKVKGQEPDWNVNPGDYEYSMNVIGRVEVEGVPMDDEDDLVAAFIGEECRGVVHPAYIERYDSYFATINIYAGSGDTGKKVTFRAYDASTGTLYPELLPDTITFTALKLTGRYEKPVVLTALDMIEQSTDLKQGWNWLSFYVKMDERTATDVLDKVADDVQVIKSQGDGWLMRENGTWSGSLTKLSNGQMYAVQMLNDRTLRLVGQPVNPAECPIELKSGWNWTGYYGRQVASVGDALADMSPEDGDMIKGQNGIAYFDSYEWAGSLAMVQPGVGYMIYAPTARQFGYTPSLLNAPKRQESKSAQSGQEYQVFAPVDYHNYSDNAIMSVRVKSSKTRASQMELAVFIDDECRTAAVFNENGTAFLTIPGDSRGTMNFKVAIGDKVYEATESFTYEADAIYGTPMNPVVIDLDLAAGIESIDNGQWKIDHDADAWYDLSGRKIINGKRSDHPLNKGIYIINGEKQVVK